jgi:Ribonuclease G/E
LAAVPALASALRQLDLAGNIGIDFPTLAEKTQRRAVDAALTSALDDWPHEQTAMNGFGFVQLVARLERPSILHLIGQNRPAAAARLLLRQAEAVEGAGAILITAHPDVTQAILPAWQDELARRTGRIIRIAPDNNLALDGGFAQSVPL